MPQITDIRPQKKHRFGEPRFNVFLDGQYAFALPAETLVKAGLKIDQQLSQEKIEKLVRENDFLKFYDYALKFLSFRPRSEKEIRDWFKKKEVGSQTQTIITAKLRNLGYLNDLGFVKWWIEKRTNFQPMGRRRIEMELKQKGISNEMVSGIKYLVSGKNETDLAKKAVEKKLKHWQNLPTDEFRQKLTGFLARRGFSWEVIEKVIKDLKN